VPVASAGLEAEPGRTADPTCIELMTGTGGVGVLWRTR